MNVLFINSVCGIRSTGRIVTELASEYIANGHTCRIAYGREAVPKEFRSIAVRIGTDIDVKLNALRARLFDNEGFNAKRATKKFIKWANKYNPDVLWLHNLHGYYLNIELLFDWIKSRPDMEVKWTLHDCWAFTGHCSYFSYVGCNRWQDSCGECCQTKKYPQSFYRDASHNNFCRKKEIFCGVRNMTLICPSQWLCDLVKKSFLGEYQVEVRQNSIDTNIFKPTPNDFREKMGLSDKKIILGAATVWDDRKGLSDFIKLSEILNDNYKIVLVGVDEAKAKEIPQSIICIPRTNSAKKLAKIYSAADVFVNPSREETFGLTTVEAMACGTPAIVYKDTACEEIARIYGGVVVDASVYEIKNAIEKLFDKRDENRA